MKLYIITEDIVDKNGNTQSVYLDCFANADEALEFVMSKQKYGSTLQLKTKEVHTLFDRLDQFKEYSNECKTWADCTNPLHDCVNCPVRINGRYTTNTNSVIDTRRR